MNNTALLQGNNNKEPSYRSSDAPAACKFANSSDCYGDELSTRTGVSSADACCALCQNTTGCKVAVWIPTGSEPSAETCLLKRQCSDPQSTGDRVRCNLPHAGNDISLPLTAGWSTFKLVCIFDWAQSDILLCTADKWAKIKTVAIVGPNANNSAQQQNSYSSGGESTALSPLPLILSYKSEKSLGGAGAVLTTVASSAAEHVPAATKVQYAALDSKSLIETSTLGPAQQQMIDEAVAAANSSDVVIAVLGDTAPILGGYIYDTTGNYRLHFAITIPIFVTSMMLLASGRPAVRAAKQR